MESRLVAAKWRTEQSQSNGEQVGRHHVSGANINNRNFVAWTITPTF